MIIDLILDRKDGVYYSPEMFYSRVRDYRPIWQTISDSITLAMDYGTEEDVKATLCYYVMSQEYNPEICDYINSVDWL